MEKIEIKFRTAHALAKKSRPFTDFNWMCDLDSKKGLDVGATYRNDKQAQIRTAKVQVCNFALCVWYYLQHCCNVITKCSFIQIFTHYIAEEE